MVAMVAMGGARHVEADISETENNQGYQESADICILTLNKMYSA
jgi:hypothetical protein